MYSQVKVGPDGGSKPANTKEDEELKNGPINKRECRDILCCLMFIAACISCVYFFAFGLANGQPSRLIAVYDKSGAPCGLNSQSSRKYLFFTIPKSGMLTYTTCVESCPKSSDTTSNCNTLAVPSGSCAKNNCATLNDIINFNANTFCYYDTYSFLGRVCAPSSSSLASFASGVSSQLNEYLDTSTLSGWINDINTARWILAASVGMAFVLGLIYMVFLRIFAGVLVWVSILLYFLGIIYLGILFYYRYKDIKDYLTANNDIENGSNTKNNKNAYLALAIIMFIFAALSFVVFLCMYKKIRQVIAIIKTTSQYVREVWSVMLVPPIFTLIVAGWWIMWLFGYVFLYAIDETGEIQKSSTTIFAGVNHSSHVSKCLWAYFFIGLWVNAFIQAVSQFTLASSACIWYFSHGEEGAKHAPVSTSLYRAFRYHLGSLAFGSLLLAIVQFIRVILAYIEQQVKKSGGGNNTFMKYLLKCMQCYAACFERFIKFLNKNAFIQIALKGSSFCVAAKDALSLVWSNADRYALVSSIGGAFIFIGKLFISSLTTFFCYLILSKNDPWKSDLNSYVLPCLIIFFISYAISIVFMSVYGMGMSAILVCFLWDEKVFQNSVPPHAPPLLQEFFENQEKNKTKK